VNGIVISSSLNQNSKSLILARRAAARWRKHDWTSTLVDLAEWELPLCDGGSCYEDPNVIALRAIVAQADAIVVASPIYNFDLNAAAKNFLELTGDGWKEKPVGFLCAAGGRASYMSPMSFANSLMLDYRCVINPRFIYATGKTFDNDTIADPEILARIDDLVAFLTRIAVAIHG
jgi:FMN reductase